MTPEQTAAFEAWYKANVLDRYPGVSTFANTVARWTAEWALVDARPDDAPGSMYESKIAQPCLRCGFRSWTWKCPKCGHDNKIAAPEPVIVGGQTCAWDEKRQTCKWTRIEPGLNYWKPSCDTSKSHHVTYGSPAESHFRFCPFCGKPIEVVEQEPERENEDEDERKVEQYHWWGFVENDQHRR